ncbi:MAG TPA: cupredoxin family copper-binding protein [Candidatus Baltobacteraceae bacterium]|nr:cupredoxin family copper-binding protein [Candidatus Baltobacteraceae bacterium]
MAKFLSALGIGLCMLGLGAQTARPAQPQTVVHMSDYAFKPQMLTVQPGDTVVFQNDDDVTHNVTADAFKSGDIAGGKSWKYTFTKSGVYPYVCTYHPGMQGTITVPSAIHETGGQAALHPANSPA